jgi:mersacidin/lichenicidin family type 2 lantibiotic
MASTQVQEVVRAWTDPDFREGLSAEVLATLPPNPAGAVELSDEDLGMVSGADVSITGTIWMCFPFPSGDTCGLICPSNAHTNWPWCCY